MNDIEIQLVKRASNGDVEAFEQLIVQYEKRVYNLAFRMCGNMEDAKELSQEAFIRMFRGIGSFRFDSKFSTWIHRITVNVCLDHLKKSQKRNIYETFSETEETVHNIKDTSVDLEEEALRHERNAVLQDALNKLTDEQKSIIILRDINGYSYQNISDIVGVPEGTVKSRINRARIALANLLKKTELFTEYKVKT